jgi:hypothetical protein
MTVEKYKKIQSKFGLPHINELKETFKIDLETNEKIFDQIRMEISDRIFVFTEKIIEPLISEPDSLSSFLEQGMISEQDRQRLFQLYKKIQVIKWENNQLSLNPDDKEAAEWIKKTWDLWNNEMKNELIDVCKKLSLSWRDLKLEKEDTATYC